MDIYDKSISHEKRAALELAEASRESQWSYPSYKHIEYLYCFVIIDIKER